MVDAFRWGTHDAVQLDGVGRHGLFSFRMEVPQRLVLSRRKRRMQLIVDGVHKRVAQTMDSVHIALRAGIFRPRRA